MTCRVTIIAQKWLTLLGNSSYNFLQFIIKKKSITTYKNQYNFAHHCNTELYICTVHMVFEEAIKLPTIAETGSRLFETLWWL